MADVRKEKCNDRCGCPVPCAGGTSCRCGAGAEQTSGSGPDEGHKRCSCGEHCGCNPCTCPKSVVSTGVGKAYCKCGDACSCATCAS